MAFKQNMLTNMMHRYAPKNDMSSQRTPRLGQTPSQLGREKAVCNPFHVFELCIGAP